MGFLLLSFLIIIDVFGVTARPEFHALLSRWEYNEGGKFDEDAAPSLAKGAST
jgi:hypothetical protein